MGSNQNSSTSGSREINLACSGAENNKKLGASRRRKALAAALISVLATNHSLLLADDNDKLKDKINTLINAHNVALPVSMTPLSPISLAADIVTTTSNIALKYVKAPLTTPPTKGVFPSSLDNCSYAMTVPQSEAEYQNLLGIWDVKKLPASWGPLGTPTVSHANTDVTVSVDNLGSEPFARTQQLQTSRFSAGNHFFQWQAETQISPIFDVTIPALLLGYDTIKYAKSITKLADQSAQQAVKQAQFQEIAGEVLQNISIELGLTSADLFSNTGVVTVTHADPEHIQQFTVFDVVPPSISTDAPTIIFEATDLGGTSYKRKEAELFASIFAADGCGRPHSLYNDAPNLLELGETTLTWTVQDKGPTPPAVSGSTDFGGPNMQTLVQKIIVKDTQAPLMLPPPGKVYETSSNGLELAQVSLGMPQVVDLADSSPTVSSNAPAFYPINSRTEVVWQSSDVSNNTSQASQWITVKELGTNTQPVAQAASASTLTSQAVDIKLRGSDSDFIDGRVDPLSFAITKQPANGEFIAPLYPYFIEDYRTQPAGPFGQEFLEANPKSAWVGENYCNPERLPLPSADQFVYSPLFMVVTDDGTQYIKDSYWECGGGGQKGETSPRISKWDSEGNFLGQGNLGDNVLDQFVLDRDGRLYLLDPVGSGSSSDLSLKSCSTALKSGGSLDCETSWKFNSSSAPNLSPGSLVYARVDRQRGLAFVTDKRRLFAFDIRGGGGDSVYLGALNDGQEFLVSCSAVSSRSGFTIDIDSNSNLYIADTCADKIHKFAPSGFASSGDFVAGEYIGWLGKCDTSTNKACDDSKQRSKGYSCTDQTCTVADSNGDKQGQFSVPLHLALDPNDILYVADYANRRIQRFAPDGSFAGEAVSTGSGINRGDEPGFILGNFDSPKTVSVNSTQFFIVDQAESFVHVFETSPFKDVTDSEATVTYVSDFSFHGAVDSFEYTVSDGLATSAAAQVGVTVNRNFRAPTATPASYTIVEDSEIELKLAGDDPDGVIGSGDFNPLDVLSFEVTEQPSNGQLIGGGADYIYRPNANFHGTDTFKFKANDGVLDSSLATVTVEVTAVNDPPVISLQPLSKVGVGFDTSLMASFTDDTFTEAGTTAHFTLLDWGDGTTVANGPIEDGGAVVVSPATETNSGLVVAKHSYQQAGDYTINFCIVDRGGAQGCETQTVSVEPRAALGVNIETSTEELAANATITYQVKVTNLEPNIGAGNGLVAESVSVTHELPRGLTLNSADSATASCSQINQQVSCSVGSMQPGAQVAMTLVASQDDTVVTNREAGFNVSALTSTNAVRDYFVGYAQTTLLADSTDSDNDGIFDVYESQFGLSVGSNDANLDPDGDGLTNLEEFNLGTSPTAADSDGDGLPDGWESANGLNALTADANLDSDGDGFSNLNEYLADRNPLVDEEAGSRLVPVLSVFANSRLTVPAVQVGPEFYDLTLELKSESPVVFELAEFRKRDIKVEIPDANVFDADSAKLVVSVVDVSGEFYRLELNLSSNVPVQLSLLRAVGSTVVP